MTSPGASQPLLQAAGLCSPEVERAAPARASRKGVRKSVQFAEEAHAGEGEAKADEASGVTRGPSFVRSSEALSPQVPSGQVKYRPPPQRDVQALVPGDNSSVARPNYDEMLKRASVVISQHITRGERATQGRAAVPPTELELSFSEEQFATPQWRCRFSMAPMGRGLLSLYSMEKVQRNVAVPTPEQIYRFLSTLFVRARLSAECSVVCLVYVERLMEMGQLRLLARNWRPISLCGLLLASKVWQDLSSWNVEFSTICPQFPLSSVNRLERQYLHAIQWDLFVSGSVYAKYYFALRSLNERRDFRQRYNFIVTVHEPTDTKRLEERSKAVQTMLYSRSL